MLGRRLRMVAARGRQVRSASTLDSFYRVALKSNISHVTFVVTGAIVFELMYGKATEMIWDTVNQGKLVHQVDWSAFSDEDEDEEDED